MILYLDCSNGVAGDMLAAALVDLADRLGIDGRAAVGTALSAAGIDPDVVSIVPVVRGGVAATRFVVDDRPGFESFASLIEAVSASSLSPAITGLVVALASRMAAAECAVHGEEVTHLHELSMLDTAVDLIAVSSLVVTLAPERVLASAPALGSGIVNSAHGRLAVPVPAVVKLLDGLPTAGGADPAIGELTTPTGAALVAELVADFATLPAGRLLGCGSGAGERETVGRPNVLRAFAVGARQPAEAADMPDGHGGPVELLETTIDDATAEVLALAADKLRELGALDVWLTPALMKKGRPGHVLHVLGRTTDRGLLAAGVFRHTSTFGLRVLPVDRVLLTERRDAVEVLGGRIGMRLGYLDGRLVTASPEFEDCRRLAAKGLPFDEVYAAAQAAAFGRFGAA